MRFRVLGPLQAAVAGVASAPTGARRRSVLALLLAHPNQVLTSDWLAERVWPDGSVHDPRSAVHTLVSRLRADLGEDVIRTHPGGYELPLADDECDAWSFERLVAIARQGTDDPGERAKILGEALSLWRGPAYQGFENVRDLHLEAVRLEEVRLAATEELGEALLAGGDAESARVHLHKLVRERPVRERARLLLMRALYALGQQADALAQYRDYRTLVAGELGLEPSSALQRLERAILRHDPSLQSAAAQPAPEPATSDVSFADLAVRYLTTDGGRRLAYATVGDGAPLVAVPAWISSLEVIGLGRDPRASLLERLSRHFALSMYDRYGTGLSPGEVSDYSLDSSVAELTAVVERIGAPVNLLGISQAGPVAVTLAARRPDLVSRLVLLGTFADARATFQIELVNALVAFLRVRWSLAARLFAELYRPNSSDEYAEHLGRVLSDSASAKVAADYLAATYEYDASACLPHVNAAALVMHYRDDQLVPYEGGRQLAAALPHARFMPLKGAYHLPDVADLARVVAAIRGFIPG